MNVSNNFTFSYLKNSAWKTFSNRLESSTMDGIKIQSKSNSSYYLQYRTRNEGKTDFYSFVTSKQPNDYAGMTGRPVQALQIQVYGNDGVKKTTGVVVMYRASVQGRWLPWVSNAEPAWMESVFKKYRLDGTIDTNSYYCGNIGQNIDGLEIRVYDEASIIDGGFTGGEAQPSLSYMVNDLSNWNSFTRGAMSSKMDGIKIQTSKSKNYYLEYKTWNEGKTDYYSAVKSTGTASNDYAGYPGRPIQLLHIQAYDSSGERLRSGIVVMYRVHVESRWLPWVSNADPQWMRDAKAKYGLDGNIDTASTYAGNKGQNINGVEVRIFEDDSFNPGLDTFSGNEIKLTTSYMADSLSNWKTFSKEVQSTKIDGIKIQTSSSNSFVLRYKSWNAGNSGYYPEVSSLGTAYNDYAGYPGKRMQLLSVQAYDHSGNRIREGVVIMYRVRINGRALPWVSNANPEWMRSVQSQYNLGGTLDYVSTYAGNAGQNIDGVEIRAFEGSTNDHPLGNLSGTEANVSLSYMRNSLSNWTSFNKSVQTSPIEGIKIQTSTSKPYYLSYKSHNQGNSDYYPIVKSTGTAYNDYAGYMNKPIQLLSIQAYRNDGTRLRTGIVVMYRVSVQGRWLPWVSNANPDWMRSVQLKYNLGGTLDTTSTYAGNRGQNINGVEIRVFEENDTNGKDPTPSGNYKIIDVPFIPQNPKYPTGCESVATVMALRHIGNNMSVDTFIDNYLNKQSLPSFDPDVGFGGNPRSTAGWGCWSPVIINALRKIFNGTQNVVKDLKGKSLSSLCTEYIDKGTPVILWATQGMRSPYTNRSWVVGTKRVTWISPMHCLLLVGYDDNNYIFNDPQDTKAKTYYSKESVEAAYAGLSKQAIVIQPQTVTPPPAILNKTFDQANYAALKKELVPLVERETDWKVNFFGWHNADESLDITLKHDKDITQRANQFQMQKALIQTVMLREQKYVWIQDDIADAVVVASYSYDDLWETWLSYPPEKQLLIPPPTMPPLYVHDSSTGLCQIYARTAARAINYAVDNGIIKDERKYDAADKADIKELWYKLKDNDAFNIKCAALTLLVEARKTLGYTNSFESFTNAQIEMLFTKYNAGVDYPTSYGKDCAKWYQVFHKYR